MRWKKRKPNFTPWPTNRSVAHNRVTRAPPTRPSRAKPTHDGKALVRWPFCVNAPDLPMNHAEVHGTISTDSHLTNITLPFSFFTMVKSPGTRARTGAAAVTPGDYAGHTRP